MRSLLFYDDTFPYEGTRPSPNQLHEIAEWAEVADACSLADRLAEGNWDSLIHLHGSYFPKAAWGAVKAHLASGGGLLHAGGVPYRKPVVRDGEVWRAERDQVAYHQLLDIHDALPVDVSKAVRTAASAEFPLLQGREALFGIEPTWGLTIHPTKASDNLKEMGAGGPMDAHLYPLLVGIDRDGRERAAPVVLFENVKGDYAGGRWILMNQPLRERFWNGGGLALLRELAEYVGRGATELWVKPNYAAYEPGEQMQLTVQVQSLSRTNTAGSRWSFSLSVSKDGEKPLWSGVVEAEAGPGRRVLQPIRVAVPLLAEPGLYRVCCEARSDSGDVRNLTQAFWGIDRELLAGGEPLTSGRDYFLRGGKPVPIVGMTYMSSDVARKFLHLPNAECWDRDMAEMKRAGINLIRTGIWTGYRTIMFADGHAAEDVMRAIDAFVLTAKRHELEVTFTFFSFAPEAWEGVNPYLDPRALEAQKRFIAAIVSRHAATTNVHWDLINEPSLFNPERIFEGARTIGDRFELAAYANWLRERHGGDLTRLQELWNMTPEQLPSFEAAMPPNPDDILFDSVLQPKKWGPWIDYSLFTMDMHNRWASELTNVIREISPGRLVTVGQDEGLGAQRPSPFFYAPVVDYTTVHSWWLNDQLAWDGIFSKTAEKPNLIQETGIMHVQRPDGIAKRSEEELRNILERKYAYAFSTGGAGAVQWIWNINPYMDNANESNIGALRADGTQKPEADVSYDFGRFIGDIAHLFEERTLEDVAIVYPYSNDFSSRKLAFQATSQAVRVLAYGMNVHPRGVGEYQLDELERHPAKLVLVPSAHNFDAGAFEQLLDIARRGATVLWTGPLRRDAYWGPADERLRDAIADTVHGNVRREEALELAGVRYPVSFGGSLIGKAALDRPGATSSGALAPIEVALGKGRFVWCPLPLELNERWEPLVAMYAEALAQSGALPELEWVRGGDLSGVYGRKLRFAAGSLFIFVSESGEDADLEVRDAETGMEYAFRLEQERTVMFAADAGGELLAVYRPDEVQVKTAKARPSRAR